MEGSEIELAKGDIETNLRNRRWGCREAGVTLGWEELGQDQGSSESGPGWGAGIWHQVKSRRGVRARSRVGELGSGQRVWWQLESGQGGEAG